MQRIMWLVLAVSLSVTVTVAAAQTATCAPMVEEALTLAGDSCGELSFNTACYGHNQVQAEFREGAVETLFASPADTVEVAQLTALRTTPYDETSNEWGIAVMNIQANVPDTLPGQGVIFLLLGDAEVVDGAVGRADRDAMQAFYFSGGIGSALCQEAPNTLAIQSPENVRVDLTVNGMDITLGSMITLTNNAANTLTITVHEGRMGIPAAGVSVNANQSVDVTLNRTNAASNISSPRPATADELALNGTVGAAFEAVGGQSSTATTTYTVQPGDTLFSIARANNTCVSAIMSANNIADANRIFVGQTLTIPDNSTCEQGIMDVTPVVTPTLSVPVAGGTPSAVPTQVTPIVTPQVTDEPPVVTDEPINTPEAQPDVTPLPFEDVTPDVDLPTVTEEAPIYEQVPPQTDNEN